MGGLEGFGEGAHKRQGPEVDAQPDDARGTREDVVSGLDGVVLQRPFDRGALRAQIGRQIGTQRFERKRGVGVTRIAGDEDDRGVHGGIGVLEKTEKTRKKPQSAPAVGQRTGEESRTGVWDASRNVVS